MNDFKTWRRRFGVFSLVIACLLMLLWLRSMHADLWTCFKVDAHRVLIVDSDGYRLYLMRMPESCVEWYRLSKSGYPYSISREDETEVLDHWDPWRFGEFVFGPNMRLSGQPLDLVIIPCWSIVIPPTLLSAYLLLSHPRPTRQTDAVEMVKP